MDAARALRYYLLGFRDLVMAKDFDPSWSSDSGSCFLGLVLEKLEKQANYILPVMPELLPALEYVAENQSQFNADKNIYGDFREKLKRIKVLHAAHCES